MRLIQKGPEPNRFIEFRTGQSLNQSFQNLPADVKETLRKALVHDQAGLCCYCMSRIRNDSTSTRIEHWQSQSAHPELSLAWKNLLAACPGNEGVDPKKQHCDVRKGNTSISISPLISKHIDSLSYATSGEIRTSDNSLEDDINNTLNLNHPTLKGNRKSAVYMMVELLVRKHKGKEFPIAALKAELSRCETPDSQGQLPPFVGALAFWIRKRLGRPRP